MKSTLDTPKPDDLYMEKGPVCFIMCNMKRRKRFKEIPFYEFVHYHIYKNHVNHLKIDIHVLSYFIHA